MLWCRALRHAFPVARNSQQAVPCSGSRRKRALCFAIVCAVDYVAAVFPSLPFLYAGCCSPCYVGGNLGAIADRDASDSCPLQRRLDRKNPCHRLQRRAFRGSLLVKCCDHCHGVEGFSDRPTTPNLAFLDRLAVWKELQDFHYGKRISPVMQPIAAILSARDSVLILLPTTRCCPLSPTRKIIAAFLRPRPIRPRQIGQRSLLP
jgi:cytochrome c553